MGCTELLMSYCCFVKGRGSAHLFATPYSCCHLQGTPHAAPRTARVFSLKMPCAGAVDFNFMVESQVSEEQQPPAVNGPTSSTNTATAAPAPPAEPAAPAEQQGTLPRSRSGGNRDSRSALMPHPFLWSRQRCSCCSHGWPVGAGLQRHGLHVSVDQAQWLLQNSPSKIHRAAMHLLCDC